MGRTGIRAAVSPAFDEDGWISMGDVEYRDGLGAVVLAHDPTGVVAFSPEYRRDRTTFTFGYEGARRCVSGLCADGPLPNGLDSFVVSPRFASRGRVAAFGGLSLYLSRDGVEPFRPTVAPVPLEGAIVDAAFDSDDRLFVATRAAGGRGAGLAMSPDDGRTWRRLGEDTPLSRGAGALEVLPDRRILASVQEPAGGGLWCSVDHGATWHPRCPMSSPSSR
jgi:hypothetical protein